MENKESASPSQFNAIKAKAVASFEDTVHKYADREEKVFQLFKNPYFNDINKDTLQNEYKELLKDNVAKLKEITKRDFESTNNDTKQLIDDAKAQVRQAVSKAFKDSQRVSFAKTAEDIIHNIHGMVERDIHKTDFHTERSKSKLSQNLDVFVSPTRKSMEEIQAERELQQLLEEQLMEYSEQFKRDLQIADEALMKQVNGAKTKMLDTIQKAVAANVGVDDCTFPSSDEAGVSVNSMLNRAGADFQQINDMVRSKVEQGKSKVANTINNVTSSIMGVGFFDIDTEDD